MSAVPPIAPELLRCSDSTKSANSGLMHCKRPSPIHLPNLCSTQMILSPHYRIVGLRLEWRGL